MDKLYRELSRRNSKRQPDKRVYVDDKIYNFNSLDNIKRAKRCSQNDDIMQSESNKKRCRVCGQSGHNSRTCSQR